MTNKEDKKQTNTENDNNLNWMNRGIREYQELYEENTKKVLQFWTDVFNFWNHK